MYGQKEIYTKTTIYIIGWLLLRDRCVVFTVK